MYAAKAEQRNAHNMHASAMTVTAITSFCVINGIGVDGGVAGSVDCTETVSKMLPFSSMAKFWL